MGVISDFKDRLFAKRLRRDTSPARTTTSHPPHPDRAGHLTILFLADSAEDRKVVDKWRDAHARADRKIRVLGYFEQEVGATNFDFSVVSVKDLNWYGVPTGEAVEAFRQEPTDILLRLGPATHPVLDYLAAIRPATLKVAPYTSAPPPFYQLLFDGQAQQQPGKQFLAIQQIFTHTNAH